MSDAGHNLSDALALGLAAYAIWIAKEPANAQRTYGYHRVGILTALFNAVTLIVIAISILVEAYHLFRAPQHVNGTLMLWVSAIALLMNTVIAYLLHGGSQGSMNMSAAFIHMAGDALSALAVLVAGFIVLKTGWRHADPVVSVLIAAFIVFNIARRANGVAKTESPRILLSGRTAPNIALPTVSMRALLGPANELVFRFAFFPSRAVHANDKVVGGMHGYHPSSLCALVLQPV